MTTFVNRLVWASVVIMMLVLFCYWQNNGIVVSESDYYNAKIPTDFDGFKLVQVSDLHNKSFGKDQERLLSRIEDLDPDLILVTGDLVDRRKYDLDTAMQFIDGAVKIAPVFFVSGNHEAWTGKYSEISSALTAAGVVIVDDAMVELKIDDSIIEILGVSDPDFLTSSYAEGTNTSKLEKQLNQWAESEHFRILLTHRPELFKLYASKKMDLIFAGHAHGGQFRFPLIGGVFAPDQGFMPEYTSGKYDLASSTLFVSRGLGNSLFPLRLFNRPELVQVTLHPEE